MASGGIFRINEWLGSGAWSALAAALALAVVPVGAMAQEHERGHRGGEARSDGGHGGGWRGQSRDQGNSGSNWRRQQQAPAAAQPQQQQQQQPRQQPQASAPARPAWSGNGDGGGWRSRNGGNAGGASEQRGQRWGAQHGSGGGASEQREQRGQRWGAQHGGAATAPNGHRWRSAPDGGEARHGWRGQRHAQQQQPAPQPGVETRRHGWNGGNGQQWSGRNRTYSDPARNPAYHGNPSYRENHNGTLRTENRRPENWRAENGRADTWRHRDGQRQADTHRWRDRRDDRQAYRSGWRDSNRHDRGHQGYDQNHRRWDRDWRHNDRYNWHSYRNHNRNHYRIGRYYSPYSNYSYRRLSIGFQLDNLFYSNQYWIDDPWSYRLPEAYGPYRWVRYYDDALLVDIYTGEVIDVINDFFW